MAKEVALLEPERAKALKERFYAPKTPYPLRTLSKLYLERHELRNFTQYDNRRGSVVEHVSKFIDTLGPYAVDEDLSSGVF